MPFRGLFSGELQDDISFLASFGNLNMTYSPVLYSISTRGSETLDELSKEDKSFAVARGEISSKVTSLLTEFNREELIRQAYALFSEEISKRQHIEISETEFRDALVNSLDDTLQRFGFDRERTRYLKSCLLNYIDEKTKENDVELSYDMKVALGNLLVTVAKRLEERVR